MPLFRRLMIPLLVNLALVAWPAYFMWQAGWWGRGLSLLLFLWGIYIFPVWLETRLKQPAPRRLKVVGGKKEEPPPPRPKDPPRPTIH